MLSSWRRRGRLGMLASELAAAYYREQGVRCAQKLGAKPAASAAAVRACFKAAAYAEFRQDWAQALRYYRAAYELLVGLPPVGLSQWHLQWERLCAAEWLHLKLCTLLLHTSPTPLEAAAQLKAHMGSTKRPPPDWPPVARPAYWTWVLRQYRAFGELLQARLPPPLPPPAAPQPAVPRELQAGFYYYAAANAGVQRRLVRCLGRVIPDSVSVGPTKYGAKWTS